MKNKKLKIFLKKYWIEICLLIITPIIASSYGINEYPILKDHGFFSYIGQELLRGYPIYSTVYVNHSPFVAIFFAFAMSFFYFLPQYLSIRVFMLIIISLLVMLFYRVAIKIFKDKIISTLSVLILISFTFFIQLSLSGDYKTLALFFSFLTLILLFRGFYLLSGISASLCFFSWQPLGLFLFAPMIFPFLESNKRRVKIEKLSKVLLGFFIPVILFVIYFIFYGSVMDLINFHLLYPLKYETKSPTIWLPLNILGYYCSEFFFLLLGLTSLLYVFYKIIKKRSLGIFRKNKYLTSFILPFLLLTLFMIKDFDDGTDLVLFLPIISILAAISLKKVHSYFTKIISYKTATILLILIVCIYGFFPALQPVYPENPVFIDRDEFVGKTSPFELISSVEKRFGVLNSLLLFLFHRTGEQITIKQQLELAKIIQNETNENEKILSLSPPEMLFLSNRRNLNPYPLFVMDIYKICRDRGDIEKTREEIIEYKPKFILANGKFAIEKLELTEFIEKNYEKMPFIYYDVYRYTTKN